MSQDFTPIEIKLRKGRIATIFREPIGADMEAATLIADGRTEKLNTAICARVVKIDGNPVTMESLSALHLKDYLKIVKAVIGEDEEDKEGNDKADEADNS